MNDNDPMLQEAIRIIRKHALYLDKHFRDKDRDELWKAASAISVASGEIVRHIVKAIL